MIHKYQGICSVGGKQYLVEILLPVESLKKKKNIYDDLNTMCYKRTSINVLKRIVRRGDLINIYWKKAEKC